MFTAALFIIFKVWYLLICQSTDEWIRKMPQGWWWDGGKEERERERVWVSYKEEKQHAQRNGCN